MDSVDAHAAESSVGERYRVLLEIGRTLAATLGSSELYEAIWRETTSVLDTDSFFICLYDDGSDEACFTFLARAGEVRPDPDVRYPGSDSPLIQARQGMVVRRGSPEARKLLEHEFGPRAGSAVYAPMLHKGELLGVIGALHEDPDFYDEDDLALLQGIADIAAIAVANALHVAELAERRREAERIEEIGRTITSTLDQHLVLGQVVQAVVSVLGADGACVWLADPDDPDRRRGRIAETTGEVQVPVGVVWALHEELAKPLLEEGEPVVVADLAETDAIPPHVQEHLSGGSGAGAPLFVDGRVVGVLAAGKRKARAFHGGDVEVLQRIARQASVALENARLHEDIQSLSLTDALTGLANRRRLDIHLEKEVAAARRGRNLVVAIFDLDDFKSLNDTYGHLVGDEILKAFAQILDDENRAMNLVTRYGGDEFVSVLSDSYMDGATLYVQRVEERVATDPVLAKHGVSVSSGVAQFDRRTMKTATHMLEAADADMYRTKSESSRRRREDDGGDEDVEITA